MTDLSNVTDLEMIIKIMIRMDSLSLFENVEFRNQRYTSAFLSFKIQICISSYLRATVSTTENIVEFIYQSDNIFPYNIYTFA